MKTLIEIIVMIFLFCIVFYSIFVISEWSELSSPCKIKFDQFKKFYYLNPSSYELDTWYAIKQHVTPPKDNHHGGRCYYQIVRFNYIDTIKYQFFRLHQLKAEHEKELDENTQRYLSYVQEDINRLAEKSEEYKQRAHEELNKVLK